MGILEPAFHTRTTDLFIYRLGPRLSYSPLLLPAFIPSTVQPGHSCRGSRDLECPSAYGTPMDIYIGFVFSCTYTPSSSLVTSDRN